MDYTQVHNNISLAEYSVNIWSGHMGEWRPSLYSSSAAVVGCTLVLLDQDGDLEVMCLEKT